MYPALFICEGKFQTYPKIFLDQELVLLRVSSGDDDVIFGGDEPEEFLEPMRVTMLVNRHCRLHLG